MAKSKKAIKKSKVSAKKIKESDKKRSLAGDPAHQETAAAFLQDLAISPPPKEIETIKAASDAVERSNATAPQTEPGMEANPASKAPQSGGGASDDAASDDSVGRCSSADFGDTADATQSAQAFAIDMQRMAKESIEQTAHVLERLREARSIEEVVSLQTVFMQQSFRRSTELAKRIGELMSASQTSLLRQGQVAMRNFRSIANKR